MTVTVTAAAERDGAPAERLPVTGDGEGADTLGTEVDPQPHALPACVVSASLASSS